MSSSCAGPRSTADGNLLIHKGQSFLGGTNRGAAAFGADGSVDIVPGNVKDADLLQDGVREAISAKRGTSTTVASAT